MEQNEGQAGSKPPRNPNQQSSHSEDEDVERQPIKAEQNVERDAIYRSMSHMSGPDTFADPSDAAAPYREAGDEIYDRLSGRRKAIIVTVMSFCAFLSPISSTSVLAATPEVAAEYNTSGSVINASNAGYMALMGVSPIVWGPMSQVFGRRPVSVDNSCYSCILNRLYTTYLGI